MFAFNGLLLISLAFTLERVFDARVALGALLFLVIDPTVAAHWPVVMTDLPVALLSATSIVLATRAFRDWIWDGPCRLFGVSWTGPCREAFCARGASGRGVNRFLACVLATADGTVRCEMAKIVEDRSRFGGSPGDFVGILLLSICRDSHRAGFFQSLTRGQDTRCEYSLLPFRPCGNECHPYRTSQL